MLRLRGKAVLGGLRKVWPVTPSADLESWISATAVSECVCVCVCWFWVGSRIKRQKPSSKLQASPSLLISGCCIFQPELVTMLVWTRVQPEQFQMLWLAAQPKLPTGEPAEAPQRCAQPSALPDSCAPWDFSKGRRRQRYSLMAMDFFMPLNGVSHFCACSFCPCSLGKDSGWFELSQGHAKAEVQWFTCSWGILLEKVSGASIKSGGIRKHILMQQCSGTGTYFLQVVSVLQTSTRPVAFRFSCLMTNITFLIQLTFSPVLSFWQQLKTSPMFQLSMNHHVLVSLHKSLLPLKVRWWLYTVTKRLSWKGIYLFPSLPLYVNL